MLDYLYHTILPVDIGNLVLLIIAWFVIARWRRRRRRG